MSAINIKTKEIEIEFGVTSFPNRNSKALYRMRGANIEVLAYFRNDQCADKFEKDLKVIIEQFNKHVK